MLYDIPLMKASVKVVYVVVLFDIRNMPYYQLTFIKVTVANRVPEEKTND